MSLPDQTNQALRLFSELTERHGLTSTHEFPQQIELSFTLLPQPGLDFRINLTLQDGDELHIYVDDVSFTFFPFPRSDVIARFRECVDGLIDGTARLDIAERFGSAARGEIIRVADGNKLAGYFRTIWPFGLTTNRSIRNQSKSPQEDIR